MNDVYKKLTHLKTSELERICIKMKYPIGNKKQMITYLLQPLQQKYNMTDTNDNETGEETDEETGDINYEESIDSICLFYSKSKDKFGLKEVVNIEPEILGEPDNVLYFHNLLCPWPGCTNHSNIRVNQMDVLKEDGTLHEEINDENMPTLFLFCDKLHGINDNEKYFTVEDVEGAGTDVRLIHIAWIFALRDRTNNVISKNPRYIKYKIDTLS